MAHSSTASSPRQSTVPSNVPLKISCSSTSPSAQTLVTILNIMDPNSNPNSQPADEQTGQSPGGNRPDEEPTAPLLSPPMGLPPTAQSFEETTPADAPPPLAEHEEAGVWTELPAGFDGHTAALFDRLQDGLIVLDFDNDRVARLQDLGTNLAPPNEAFALIRQLEALPEFREPSEDHLLDAWQDVMQTLSPEHQIVLRDLANDTHRVLEELDENPNLTSMTADEISAIRNNLAEIRQNAARLPAETQELLTEWFAEIDADTARLLRIPAQVASARQSVVTLLDNLVNTDREAVVSDAPVNSSPQCPVCFEDYIEGDVVVLLPCHPSHHFHRACIHDWLQALLPHPFTCPTCRAPILVPTAPVPDPQ
ncbi:hypothetical protein PTTG_12525 [Puccinia triticina 1-1 BBBD Race 1]|uniref:RING-type E3 ubiquitin transferase n=2 Tax=Puccinia triticina TaxID=208348 RepID=A0A180G381_PUCT1|nr:uncharacterized protein PtA15_6A482 [Puccinia triticina]OAV87060.1 hypothetical protein PTTG_12525 [Puccinia triticina 1-1 BBBD Race 1]WAQ85853.1 hypothetical protein PtA15_6A482 [Puccinia triticina]WAR55740.1 hypothetical protein PtB15_6B483 [Puccinia triticina]